MAKNEELIRNLQHAIKHLTHNHINQEDAWDRSWYSGDKDRFIRRHNKAIICLRQMVTDLGQPTPTDQQPRFTEE